LNLIIRRSIENQILKDLSTKIIILSGPRQCGKTTLSKSLFTSYDYLNYDSSEDRLKLLKKQWDRKLKMVIFDEIHKMKKWKSWLKGIYDKEGVTPHIMVTGSAKMNLFKKAGDSLAGRHFNFRLYPFDLKELNLKFKYHHLSEQEIFNRLMRVGGFPEPFLNGDPKFYNRWRKSHIDLILRQDLIDLGSVRDINALETLILLLSERVGTPISYASLAKDLERDPKTIKAWLNVLENLYVIFKITPFHKDIARSIKKEPKYYFYDNGLVRGHDGAKLENIVACSLLKEVHRLEDVEGFNTSLYYLKAKGGKEIDFLVLTENERPWLIEVKWGERDLSPNFKIFQSHFKNPHRIQLVYELEKDYMTQDGHEIRRAIPWLSSFNLVP